MDHTLKIESLVERLMAGEAPLSLGELHTLLFSSVEEIANAANDVDESTDYVLEAALEQLAGQAQVSAELVARVESHWLYIDHVPGGTSYEVAVRCAEFLAQKHREKGISDTNLETWAGSHDWRVRLVCAWCVREAAEGTARTIRAQLAQDPFQDDDGMYLIREGAGHYDD